MFGTSLIVKMLVACIGGELIMFIKLWKSAKTAGLSASKQVTLLLIELLWKIVSLQQTMNFVLL